jgi:hypothetical protein
MKKLAQPSTTVTGFPIVVFDDYYGHFCSLQASSLALYEQPGTSAVWLGVNQAEPKVMASKAHWYGVKTNQKTGWVPYPIPDGVNLNTRMHLDRNQVSALIKHLQRWLDSGKF